METNKRTLQKYAKPATFTESEGVEVPLSYNEWYASRYGIIPGNEYKQYNEYLLNWYKNKKEDTLTNKEKIKKNYLSLLKQLQIFYSNEEIENWYKNIDLDNEDDLLRSIPYFAKKLKEISLYYLQLRKDVQSTRFIYNQLGTNSGLLQQIRQLILTNFSLQSDNALSIPYSVQKTLPNLNEINNTLNIQIQELYDTSSYLDQSPALSASTYFNINNPTLLNVLESKNLESSAAEWLYKLGTYSLSTVFENISETENILEDLSKTLNQKYLGTTITNFISSTTTALFSTQKDFYNIDINIGNNFFYWPNGAYRSNIFLTPIYKPTPLSALNVNTLGTAGSSISASDFIFIKTARDTQGAWLRQKLFNEENNVLYAILDGNSQTAFRYPYPGYGLSAEDLPWTGYSLSSDPRFLYLEDGIKKSIETVYWSAELSGTTDKLLLNDTTLAQCSAYADTSYETADKIRIVESSPEYSTAVLSNNYTDAWLYKFTRTDIPIKPSGNTVIYWPFERVEPEEDFPDYYPTKASEICLPVAVSSVNFSTAIASNALSSADVIYKLNNYKDTIDLATECCWLSGREIGYPKTELTTIQQKELQLSATAGDYTRFVWTGTNNTNVNTVFKTLQHQPDCKFVTTQNTTYLDANLCTCRQVLFTPFGHPGTNYTDNESFADFIIEDNFTPGNLDLSIWKDDTNTGYAQSSGFCWYKTNSKISWGDGVWYSGASNTSNTLRLQTGKPYVYFRAQVKKQDKEVITLPSYILKYPYSNNINTAWIRAYKNNNNEWVSSNQRSSMIFYPGDILLYQRANSTTYTLSSIVQETIDISENRNSIWTNFDYISLSPDKQVVLNYPYQTFLSSTDYNEQYPVIGQDNILSILQWSISGINTPIRYFKNTPSILFTPTVTGLYTFAVTAVSATQLGLNTYSNATSGYYYFTNIPALTVIPNTTLTPKFTSFNIPAPGYVLNSQLSGWTYPTTTESTSSIGAKPFWSQSTDIWESTQRIFDGHNIITQPEFSQIYLNAGNYFEYDRVLKSNLIWKQPILLKTFVDEKIWSAIEFSTNVVSNLSSLLNNIKTDTIVVATTAASPIVLQNFVDNEPVEVYYNALNNFTWSITAEPLIENIVYTTLTSTNSFIPQSPWKNTFNQNYPTVAAVPSFDNLYTTNELGGYFVPKNLGVTTYFDKDTVTQLEISALNSTPYFASQNKINSRGLSKTEQSTPYKIVIENCVWQKEPITSNAIAGTNNKKAFRRHQKFIPYTSGFEKNIQHRVGLINQASRQSPWVGSESNVWGDPNTYPVSPTGELNINVWKDAQFLKSSELQLDNWVTDIFGNQYGLYKNIKNKSFIERKNILGEIWVRDNLQNTKSAKISLANVFDSYKSTTLINSLTGSGVKRIDTFFDVLFVEAQNVLFFEKLNYDYDTNNIFSITDNARHISLALPITLNINREFNRSLTNNTVYAKAGETWFFPNDKKVIISTVSLSSFNIIPELYQLDLVNNNLLKLFPATSEDGQQLTTLNTLKLKTVNEPCLTFNSLLNEFVIAFTGTDIRDNNQLIEITVINTSTPQLKQIQTYAPITTTLDLPVINSTLEINANVNVRFSRRFIAINGPVTFKAITKPSWLTLTVAGRFTGRPTTTGIFYTVFTVSNKNGTTYYTLTINVT